jgi:hypothetical protein
MFTMEIYPGKRALPALTRTGLLVGRDLPVDPEDLYRFLQLTDTYAVIGYRDGVPQGYVICCKRFMEHEMPELFILQVAGDGGPGWVTEGWQQLHKFAARIGCHRIGAMFPVDRAPVLCRRFGFRPEGVFCVTPVRGEGAH